MYVYERVILYVDIDLDIQYIIEQGFVRLLTAYW